MQAISAGDTGADLSQLCVNTIRFLSIDAVEKAKSGHPGLPLGAAPMAYVLWAKVMNYHAKNPSWWNRDRFILSAGHGSALLYSMLHLAGYELPLEQLAQFRQWDSMTPGHPERGFAPGVEVATGPLGQGFANGVGMAIAEAHLAARYNREGYTLFDHYTYAIVSDGDLMEGVAAEAASLAGHLRLGKLIYLYDDNEVTLSASTQVTFTENRAQRFESYGWQVLRVEDGNNLRAIEDALLAARLESDRPTLIIIRTHIGYGSPKQDSFEVHGSPLGPEDTRKTKEAVHWPLEPHFHIPEVVKEHFRQIEEKGERAAREWAHLWEGYSKTYPALAQELQDMHAGNLPAGWDKELLPFAPDPKGMATRLASGKILNMIASHVPALLGGSADLNPSTYTVIQNGGTFESPLTHFGDLQGEVEGGWNYAGRNIHFGVREHAMGAIVNGLAAHGGLIPYGATFLTFSDYMKPAIRLAALMELPALFIFTHDSVGLGEDGPTHQPIEHLAGLRAIPQLTVLRPADANETAIAWRLAVESHRRPTVLILTRQNVPTLDRTRYASEEGVRKGGYILFEPEGTIDLILIASGSEVGVIVEAQKRLAEKGLAVRLVSMPSWDLFESQSLEYRETVLPKRIKARLAVEAGATLGWERYVGSEGTVVGIDRFGGSAPGPVVLKECGITPEHVIERAIALLTQ